MSTEMSPTAVPAVAAPPPATPVSPTAVPAVAVPPPATPPIKQREAAPEVQFMVGKAFKKLKIDTTCCSNLALDFREVSFHQKRSEVQTSGCCVDVAVAVPLGVAVDVIGHSCCGQFKATPQLSEKLYATVGERPLPVVVFSGRVCCGSVVIEPVDVDVTWPKHHPPCCQCWHSGCYDQVG